MDRLINELNLSPTDAYKRIQQVVEHVNIVVGTLGSEDWSLDQVEVGNLPTKDEESTESDETEDAIDIHADDNFDDELAEVFSPIKGNVVFAAAGEGWGFSIEQFCNMYAQKLGIKKEKLLNFLWGNYYFNPKTKQIFKKDVTGNMVPMFVLFVLQNVWQAYNAATEARDKIPKIIQALGLQIPPRELNSQDSKTLIEAIFTRWLPLAPIILEVAVRRLPGPKVAQANRINRLWQPPTQLPEEIKPKIEEIEKNLKNCLPDVDVVIFVSKVISVPYDSIAHVRMPVPRRVPRKDADPADPADPATTPAADPAPVPTVPKEKHLNSTGEKFIGFSRIFSGTVKVGQKLHVFGPRYNPLEPEKYHTELEITELFLLMGRTLEPVNEVPAGNVFGIGGAVDQHILKTATLSTSREMTIFNSMLSASSPIVRVALEAENPTEMPKLVEGLKILNQSDPSVEVLVQETGEHVIVASGELHLARCLTDLRERWAKIQIRVSEPIVAFRETITNEPSQKFPSVIVSVPTANKVGHVKVSAIPLPSNIRKYLMENSSLIRGIFVDKSVSLVGESEAVLFRERLQEEFKKAGPKWENELNNLWSFGPKRVGANILLNHIQGYHNTNHWNSLWKEIFPETQTKDVVRGNFGENSELTPENLAALKLESEVISPDALRQDEEVKSPQVERAESVKSAESINEQEKFALLQELNNSFITGFQLATAAGPLCEEPMAGVCFIVEEVHFTSQGGESIVGRGPFSGQMMSAMKESCRRAFLSKSLRIMEPMYLCDIQIPSTMMGQMYAVLGRRRAKILREEVKEGTYIYITRAYLPVIESFGLSEELLTQTSGAASIQLVFSHYKVFKKDPFFVASTEEELEDIGDNLGGVAPNLARTIVDGVRRRKGLKVETKLVENPNKQRTRSKNK
eukprot:TRINITY_DN5056_c0_g1_i1.p1 TRINITY_DN5056_c0_g1~~TRINITY_DN5056_c0_g1_i1.p1  ORF type:complete len:1064 (-),score=378.08 TRINITY_DN5056_c0_g1_i1:194-2935(-)